MSILFPLLLLAACLLLLSMMNAPRRRAQNATWETDDHLGKGESALLRGELGEAAGHFQRAYYSSKQGYAPIFRAEACYGLARVCERQGDLEGAARYLNEALSHEPDFKGTHPNYAGLLRRHLAEVEEKLGK